MEWLVENQELVIGGIVSVATALFILLKAVAKLTKTEKDDQLVEAIEEVKEGIENELKK